MGLFDFLKPKKSAGFENWHAETDLDKFSGIGRAEIESYVSRIDDEIYEFVILTPPEPVDGCDTFVIYKDGGLKMEFSIKLILPFLKKNVATAIDIDSLYSHDIGKTLEV